MKKKRYFICVTLLVFAACLKNKEVSNQETDQRVLTEMFEEISDIAMNVACDDASDWSFTPYGSKACGGPQGYVAYSNQIDVNAFLAKVAMYTEAEREYNIKWGIISTCDLPPQPVGVSCVNGEPVLNY